MTRLTASVARKLVEMLNEVKAGTFVPKYPLDNVTMKHRVCHCKGFLGHDRKDGLLGVSHGANAD